MAEETDQHEKTEDPTPKRLQEAREKGQVAASREVNHWFMMLAATISVLMFVPALFRDIGSVLAYFISEAGTVAADPKALGQLLSDLVYEVVGALVPVLALLVVAALGAGLIQNGLVVSFESIKPKLQKISPLQGAKRLFSAKSLVEFVKGMIKISVVGTVMVMVVWPTFDRIVDSATIDAVLMLDLLRSLILRLLMAIVSVLTVVAGLDVLFQRWDHLKSLRMSRQEIKEELKQSEGDPHIRARLRQIRMERARRRMMAKVPEADVVITNPTHYAVALAYKPETMVAPVLVAKGADAIAQRIREVAEEHAIPLVENPPLARALYATVELDQEIPPEHYRAVAEVIGFVMNLRRRPARD